MRLIASERAATSSAAEYMTLTLASAPWPHARPFEALQTAYNSDPGDAATNLKSDVVGIVRDRACALAEYGERSTQLSLWQMSGINDEAPARHETHRRVTVRLDDSGGADERQLVSEYTAARCGVGAREEVRAQGRRVPAASRGAPSFGFVRVC